MPTGTGAFNIRNLPNTKYKVDAAKFAAYTSREFFNPASIAVPASGSYSNFQLPQTGIIGAINVRFVGTITTTGTTVTVATTAHYPWNLLKFTLSGNGQNNFIACDGLDLKTRELVANRAFLDGSSSYPASTDGIFSSAGSAAATLNWRIPIAMDDTTLTGALYAQSEATNLTLKIDRRVDADLFDADAGSVAVTGNLYFEEEIYDIPYDPDHSDTLLIPDLTVLHGMISNENAIASLTTLDTPLQRINGDMHRLIFYSVNLSTADEPGLVTTATYNYASLMYGANKSPYTFNPMGFLQYRNNRDARRVLTDGVFVLDLASDNPARDRVILEGVTNLKLRTNYSSAPTGGSFVHYVMETLFA